ncbi:hypothetical protein [Corynebacterium sp.]|uniref:hypothetical protein n=1 Tax=Corynebacterium sp. TaxID=1720 RepID=UPI0025C29F89|nr:hypothetical protein [Corynebacterium sp.]
MTRIDKAMQCILDAEEKYRGHNCDIYPDDLRRWLHALADAGLLAPDPQIIRTPAELEALDPDTLIQPPLTAFSEWPQIITAAVLLGAIRTWEGPWLPAVKVAEGAHLRACREALEGEEG